MERLAEIEKRMSEIKTELETADEARMAELEAETTALIEERKTIRATAEKRKALLGALAEDENAKVISKPEERRKEEKKMTQKEALRSSEYRSYWAKSLLCQTDFTEAEKRAAGVALTTTSTTYTAASSASDGVNNGGLFIPESVLMDIVKGIAAYSPVFRDATARATAITGIVKFPYEVSSTGAAGQTEGVANPDESIQWADLELATSEISKTVRVSWKLEALTPDSFIDYLVQELIDKMSDEDIREVIYGTGTNEVSGITATATAVTYTEGDYMEGIEAAIAGLTDPKAKIGAKLYISSAAAEGISFTKDADGDYIFSPFNNSGLKTIATYPVEIDPYLDDDDIIFGNLERNYKYNVSEQLSITKDVSGKNRINDYTGYKVVAGKLVPGKAVWAHKST